jgi:cell pole-organizing protein PopZ
MTEDAPAVPEEAPHAAMSDAAVAGPVEADLVQMILGHAAAGQAEAPHTSREPDPVAPVASSADPPVPDPVEHAEVDHRVAHEPPVPLALDATMPDHPMPQVPDSFPVDLKPVAPGEPLVTAESAAATQSVVAGLMRQLSTERSTPVYREGPSLEDLVREEMRPLLKYWLDTHLPPMVERLVRSELDRLIARAAP